MGFLDKFKPQCDEFDGAHHASVTHELLSSAVAYQTMKAYNDHSAKNGKPVDHAMAKQVVAGLAGAALDHLIETKGLDYWDEHKRKKALEQAQTQVNETIVVEEYYKD